MKLPELRLIHTTVVRLAIKSVLLYGLIVSLVIAALYWVNVSHVDEQLESELEQEILRLNQMFESAGSEQLIKHIDQLQQQEGRIYFLMSASGNKLAGNLFGWPEDVDIEFDGRAHSIWVNDEVIPRDVHDDDAYWPVAVTRFADGSQLLLARNVEQAETLQEFSEFLIEAMGLAMAFAVLIAVVLGRQILKRMDIISATASDIMAGDLSQRIPLGNKHDEFDTLANRLNAMLDRIQQLIKGLREVTDNIAHDLRSPLTRLRNQMEVTLLEPRSEGEYQKVLRQSVEDIEGLIKTFNALLGIAQAEAGNHRTLWGQVDLRQLAVDLVDLYTPLTEDKQQTLKLHNGHGATIFGSRNLLAQSLGNLLENAIKYTPEGGTILLQINTSASHVEVSISDTGPGIPESEKAHVLEKFVRLENSRHTPGNGLGLSLVQAVASLHKATLELENTHPGLKVIQRFPR